MLNPKMLKQMQGRLQKMEEELASLQVEASAGGVVGDAQADVAGAAAGGYHIAGQCRADDPLADFLLRERLRGVRERSVGRRIRPALALIFARKAHASLCGTTTSLQSR